MIISGLTPDLQVCLSWGLIAESYHSLRALSISCFHVISGRPCPRFPSKCMTQAVLPAPFHVSIPADIFLSFRMRSRSSMPRCESSSLDLIVTMSCGLTLQMSNHCPVIPLQTLGGLALSMVKSHCHWALRSAHKSCTRGLLSCEVAGSENW